MGRTRVHSRHCVKGFATIAPSHLTRVETSLNNPVQRGNGRANPTPFRFSSAWPLWEGARQPGSSAKAASGNSGLRQQSQAAVSRVRLFPANGVGERDPHRRFARSRLNSLAALDMGWWAVQRIGGATEPSLLLFLSKP